MLPIISENKYIKQNKKLVMLQELQELTKDSDGHILKRQTHNCAECKERVV